MFPGFPFNQLTCFVLFMLERGCLPARQPGNMYIVFVFVSASVSVSTGMAKILALNEFDIEISLRVSLMLKKFFLVETANKI